MADFFAELKRRHIYRVAVAYAVVAWVLLQIVNNVAPVLDLPVWVARTCLFLLFLGFPVALFFAWMRDLPSGDSSAVQVRITRMDWALFGALLIVIGLVSYQQLAPTTTTSSQQSGVEAARAAAARPSGVSVAVLPFANLSSDKEQEFFSDGMTEEITTALAKIPDLRVVARQSAFQYKGEKTDMRAVGQALNATHLIEGSVRKAGDRVRIAVQLVKAEDGVNIWANSYDRELTDVFAIQEDIARAIAASLNMQLGLKPGENLVANRVIDPERYQRYLRVRAILRATPGQQVREMALPELEMLVSEDPGFAPAWALLSRLYITFQSNLDNQIWTRPIEETRRQWQPAFDKSEKAAREAIRLDPRQAFAYSNLAFAESNRKNWAAAEDLYRKAAELDPTDPDVLFQNGYFLIKIGRVKDAIRITQQAEALEPLDPQPTTAMAVALLADGQADAAIALLERKPAIRLASRLGVFAAAYAMAGRYDDAAGKILLMNRNAYPADEVAQLMRSAPAKVSDLSGLSGLNGYLDFAYGYVGAQERLLDYPERAMRAGELAGVNWFAANYAPARKTERFKKLVREAGLVDYWKARGWPDLCHPMGADDFACE